MKALAVVTSSLYEKIEDNDKYVISIDDLKIPLAFVQANEPEFDSAGEEFSNSVLVRKTGFSLNYRDLALMEWAWTRLSAMEQDSYYPIGSDFAGYVEVVGKNVTSFREGDLVLGNCSYPYGEHGALPGVPSNHASKEFEVYHFGKLMKVPSYISAAEAGTISIGTQTAMSIVRKANIKEEDNVLVTSVTSNTSFFLLNALWERKCNVYGLSYSGKNTEKVKNHFPFIKEIYNAKENNIPENLLFDAVLDAFSDTYLESLIAKLNTDARYVTCGIFSQTSKKIESAKMTNLSMLIGNLMIRNVNFIGNCLGNTQDLEDGLKLYEKHKMVVDRIFTENDSLESFISKTYNLDNDKFGKVLYQY
jgi:NADPH:quinone reductase-like Zn-dependent oxidoreductase